MQVPPPEKLLYSRPYLHREIAAAFGCCLFRPSKVALDIPSFPGERFLVLEGLISYATPAGCALFSTPNVGQLTVQMRNGVRVRLSPPTTATFF